MLSEQHEQPCGRIGTMNRPRDAGEVLEHLDQHGVPVGLTNEEFRDTGGGLRHDEIDLAPNIQGNGIGMQMK